MGSTNSTEQVREFISERVTSVLQETLVAKTTTVETSGSVNQRIDGLTILPPPPGLCPQGQAPRDVNITQDAAATTTVAMSLTLLSAQDIATSVQKSIQDAVNSRTDIEKRDSLAFTDNVNTSQHLKIRDKTITELRSTIQMKLNTYVQAVVSHNQTMYRITMYMPCRDTNIVQRDMQDTIITDFAASITQMLLRTEEAQNYVTSSTSETDQRATGTLTVALDTAGAVINRALSTAGVLGSFWMIMVIVAIVIIPWPGFPPKGKGRGGGDPSFARREPCLWFLSRILATPAGQEALRAGGAAAAGSKPFAAAATGSKPFAAVAKPSA